ncbi:MAG: ACT domain-containing protein [SAR324 cluster bacterium]|nr:ACT domain-containing protein [SAR324 cluster bacterium]
MQILKLKILPGQFSIHKLLLKDNIPDSLFKNRGFFSLTFTDDEKSLICESNIVIESTQRDDKWNCIKLVGQLEVEATGIWSKITTICSNSGCSVLTVTTFNTDYFLVKTRHLDRLKSNFLENNFVFVDSN